MGMVVKDSKHKRILIFGASGSGKNWLGERLSEKSGMKFYDTDDLAWVKRFTVRRDYAEKVLMLKKICKRDKWIIGTGATTYVGCAERRADLIIILKTRLIHSSYRIIRRSIKNRALEKSGQPGGMFGQVYGNYKSSYKKSGKAYNHFEMLKSKYPKKVKVFSQREKREFLKRFGS